MQHRTLLALAGLAAGAPFAVAQTNTSALCVFSPLSDPSCWKDGIVPINTETQRYNVVDPSNFRSVSVDLPATLDSISAPQYRFYVYQPFTANGAFDFLQLIFQSPADVTLGDRAIASSLPYIQPTPGSNITLYASDLTLGTVKPLSSSTGDPYTLTVFADTLTVHSEEQEIRFEDSPRTPGTISLPETTSILNSSPPGRVYVLTKVDAPLLQEVSASVLQVEASPNQGLEAPNLTKAHNVRLYFSAEGDPLVFNTGPLTVDTLWVSFAKAPAEEYTLPQFVHAENIDFLGNQDARLVLPNLEAVEILGGNGHHLGPGGLSAPKLRSLVLAELFGTQGSTPPSELDLPLITQLQTPAKFRTQIDYFDRVNMPSLERFQNGIIRIQEGATANLSSLRHIIDATVLIEGDLEAPLPPIETLTNSYFWLWDNAEMLVLSESIDSVILDLRDGAEAYFPLATTLTNSALTVVDARVEMPVLETANSFDISLGGGQTEVSVPNLGPIDLLNLKDAPSTAQPSPGIALLDLPKASARVLKTPHGRYIATMVRLGGQTELDGNHDLSGYGFEMPNVTSIDDTPIETTRLILPSLTTDPNAGTLVSIKLREWEGTPFELVLNPDVPTAGKIETRGSGVLNAAGFFSTYGFISLEHGTVRVNADIGCQVGANDSVLEVNGSFYRPDGEFRVRGFNEIRMLGEGDRELDIAVRDRGPDEDPETNDPLTLTVGSPETATQLQLTPRPSSFYDALYLEGDRPGKQGLTIYPGSTLVLNDRPVFIAVQDGDEPPHYVPLASFIPDNARCAPYSGGTICRRLCMPDRNNDNVLDSADIRDFVAQFLQLDPAVDLDGDGYVTLRDIQVFVAAFLEGC